MLLTVDIGNTETTLGLFQGEELRSTWHIATNIDHMADEYAAVLMELLNHQGLSAADINRAAMCSVVPPMTTTFKKLITQYFGVSPLVVEAGVKTRVRIRMDNPREVGADRIANAAAAHHLYEGPLIIADLGTATSFDVVSKEGDYIGGAIAPGINTAAESLFTQAAMLPKVELSPPQRAIGSNTISAMQSGIVFGYVELIQGMVARIQKEIEGKAKVVATGGCAELIAAQTKVIDVVNTELTLIGLRLIYEMNQAGGEKSC